MQPGLTAYARVSHARKLLGDAAGGHAGDGLALDAARGPGRAGARGRASSSGELRVARAPARGRRRVRPAGAGALPALRPRARRARAGRRRARAAAGAIAAEREAVDAIPLPQYVAELGDLDAAHGRPPRRAASSTR